ncbi:MAG TPA: flagellar hook protein FlgE [Glaciihabitans sp.]|nr:flagellar hook protein FlgE [Glaciihabitans sp.]
MLRSLYSGISGLRSHQTMLDVTGNNIANVNTAGFKGSAVQFQDTLSQTLAAGGSPTDQAGATNPAQVGLGVAVAAISTNFAQGSGQATGKATDLMISGDGFFVVQSGAETTYTRAGAFDFDTNGRLVSADGGLVQGWPAVNGTVSANGALSTITLPTDAVSAATPTTEASFSGNLPEDAIAGTSYVRDLEVFDESGSSTTFSLTFTRTAQPDGWSVSDSNAQVVGTLEFTNGALTSGATQSIDGVDIDFSELTGFAKLTTIAVDTQNGRAAGSLIGYQIGDDGIVTGTFSNGATAPIALLALATFPNTEGLEKVGGSGYVATASSGASTLGAPGSNGVGALATGYLEMSNVDLSQEFTNLIVAQRGFQANARIITTSDEVLQELTNLKR